MMDEAPLPASSTYLYIQTMMMRSMSGFTISGQLVIVREIVSIKRLDLSFHLSAPHEHDMNVWTNKTSHITHEEKKASVGVYHADRYRFLVRRSSAMHTGVVLSLRRFHLPVSGIVTLSKKSLSRLLIILTGVLYQSSIKVGETTADPAKTVLFLSLLSVVLTALPRPLKVKVLSFIARQLNCD